jgi:hypothetical protein
MNPVSIVCLHISIIIVQVVAHRLQCFPGCTLYQSIRTPSCVWIDGAYKCVSWF